MLRVSFSVCPLQDRIVVKNGIWNILLLQDQYVFLHKALTEIICLNHFRCNSEEIQNKIALDTNLNQEIQVVWSSTLFSVFLLKNVIYGIVNHYVI